MYGEPYRLSVSAFATAARKSFNGKFTAFYVTITDADNGCLKFLHTLFEFDVFGPHVGGI